MLGLVYVFLIALLVLALLWVLVKIFQFSFKLFVIILAVVVLWFVVKTILGTS